MSLYHFKVAEHIFSLDVSDSFPVDKLLDNYMPFVTGKSSDLIFSFSVVDDLGVDESKKKIMVNDPCDDKDMAKIDLYQIENSFFLELGSAQTRILCAKMLFSEDLKNVKLKISENLSRGNFKFAFNTSLMIAFAFCTAHLDTLEMHSSVIKKDGYGYMFLGVSGTGKSTHSSLWLKHIEGCELLNDDNPIIRIIDGVPYVYGSPWSGKTPCYKNDKAIIGAFVDLEQYKENIIRQFSLLESYAAIYCSCSGLKIDKKMGENIHNTLEKVVLSVPVYHLQCLPDQDAAILSSSTIIHKD